MMKIKVQQKHITIAENRAKQFKGNKYSIIPGGKVAGFLCEEIFIDNFGGTLVASTSYNHDVVLPDGKTVDIKTKRCSSEPKPNYTCSVAAYQKDRQKCDYYVFFRVLKDLSYCWINGYMSKQDFFKKSDFIEKGTRDGPFVAHADMYSIAIDQLDDVALLL